MTEGTEQPGPRKKKPDLRVLNSELDNPETAAEPNPPKDEPKGRGRKPTGPKLASDLARRDEGEIYPGCPVVALGVHGKLFFYLDWLGQLQAIDNHSKDRMRAVFGGRSEILQDWFPQFNKSGGVSGWSQEHTATHMVRACAEKGVWNAFERVRGLGAWLDDDDGVVLHCGDAVLHKGAWKDPSEIEGHVYPSAIRVPRPIEAHPHELGNPGQEALEVLMTWNWARGDVDAYLALGWVVSALFGGALKWRPLMWITGDAGTGKSTLQELLEHLLGGQGSVLKATDATEAGIRQILGQNTIPVMLDEMEAEARGDKARNIIKLARTASSSGQTIRGGADHQGQNFRLQSCFLFSSILVPSMLDQDISRIALLELMMLEKGTTAPDPEPRRWQKIGRAIRTRVIDGWPRRNATLELYRAALAEAGHSARGCDQFGTLLAMADLALYDELPSPERCTLWADKLSAASIDEQTDQSTDWQRCLNHLFGQQVDLYRAGERLTVGKWVLIAAGLDDSDEMSRAVKALSSIGLRVYGRRDTAQLAIANSHPGLSQLFEGTQWYAPAGQRGVWAQATKRIPGSLSTGSLRFDLVGSRARQFPLRSVPIFADDKEMTGSAQPSASQSSNDPNDFA